MKVRRSSSAVHGDREGAALGCARIVVAAHDLIEADRHEVAHFREASGTSAHAIVNAHYASDAGHRLDGGFKRASFERLAEGEIVGCEESALAADGTGWRKRT